MNQNRCWNGCVRVAGVEVLRYRISLPAWEEFAAVTSFYETLGENGRCFCEESLRARAESDFAASEEVQRKFHFPTLRYTLTGRVTYENRERGIASVLLTAELKRGAGELLRRYVEAHTWELADALLLPPSQALARQVPDARLPRSARHADGVLLDAGSLYWTRNGVCRALILPSRDSSRLFLKKTRKKQEGDGKKMQKNLPN